LAEPFISFTDSLPCDSAVAMQVPHDPEREGINPYTTATALDAGWVWNIPLCHRLGTGYVYASAFLTPEQAEREYRQHLGERADGCNALHIKMRVGRNRNSWVKNCVAIGLASGFVEPLESTGIFFIQHGIEQLVNHFPHWTLDEESIRSYNEAVAECIDGVREFLTLHYVAGTRQDTPFWKATKHDLMVPNDLAERLRLWKRELPTKRTINPREHGFTAYSYCVMLVGLGQRPEQPPALIDYLSEGSALSAFQSIRRRAEYLVKSLPPLSEYLSVKNSDQRRGTEAVSIG
jgi:tryptophan halogenase